MRCVRFEAPGYHANPTARHRPKPARESAEDRRRRVETALQNEQRGGRRPKRELRRDERRRRRQRTEVKGRAWFQVGRLVREGRTKRPEGSDPVADEAMERVRRIARLVRRHPMIGFIVRHRDRPCPAYVVLVGRMRRQRLRDGGGQQRQRERSPQSTKPGRGGL